MSLRLLRPRCASPDGSSVDLRSVPSHFLRITSAHLCLMQVMSSLAPTPPSSTWATTSSASERLSNAASMLFVCCRLFAPHEAHALTCASSHLTHVAYLMSAAMKVTMPMIRIVACTQICTWNVDRARAKKITETRPDRDCRFHHAWGSQAHSSILQPSLTAVSNRMSNREE